MSTSFAVKILKPSKASTWDSQSQGLHSIERYRLQPVVLDRGFFMTLERPTSESEASSSRLPDSKTQQNTYIANSRLQKPPARGSFSLLFFPSCLHSILKDTPLGSHLSFIRCTTTDTTSGNLLALSNFCLPDGHICVG